MRDIVSKHGTIRAAGPSASGGSFAYNANCNTTANGVAISTANYNGVMIYILGGTYQDGNSTFTIYESADPSNTAVGSVANWHAVANNDLVLWKATSNTDYTPVKVGRYQPSLYPANSAANTVNMRVGYLGSSNYGNASLETGTNPANWVMVNYTNTGSGGNNGQQFTVVVELGEPRFMPSAV